MRRMLCCTGARRRRVAAETAQASTGPFYCPEDQKVYIDLSFWDELKKFGGSTADFAQALCAGP